MLPSQTLQKSGDEPDPLEVVLGLEVILGTVIPEIDQAQKVVKSVAIKHKLLENLLVQIAGQQEPLPEVLLRAEVFLGRGLPRLFFWWRLPRILRRSGPWLPGWH